MYIQEQRVQVRYYHVFRLNEVNAVMVWVHEDVIPLVSSMLDKAKERIGEMERIADEVDAEERKSTQLLENVEQVAGNSLHVSPAGVLCVIRTCLQSLSMKKQSVGHLSQSAEVTESALTRLGDLHELLVVLTTCRNRHQAEARLLVEEDLVL